MQGRSNDRQTLSNSSQTIVRAKDLPLSVVPERLILLSSSRYAFEPGSIVFCLFIVSLECSNRGPSGFVFRVLLRLQALKQKPLDTRYRHSGTTGILNLRGLWPQFSAMRSEQIHQRRMSRILRSQRLQILRSYDRLTTFDYV